MQKPAETHSPVDDDVGALREARVSPPTQAAPVHGSHSTPPPQGPPREVGGPSGPEPTRYGDWERKGRCIDF